MSIHKIGDYVHYRYEHYKEFGISVKGQKSHGANHVFQQHQNMLKRIANQRRGNKEQIKKDLEMQLNFFFNPKAYSKSINANFTDKEIKDMQDAIKQIFAETVAHLNPNIDLNEYHLNYKTLSAYVKDTSSMKVQASGARGVGQGKTGNTWNVTILDRIKKLLAHRELIAEDMDKDAVKFKKELEKFEKEYEGLLAKFSEQGEKKQIKYGSNQNFIDDLNELIEMTKIQTASQIQGLMGEYIPAITQYVLENKIQVTTEDLLKSFLVADKLIGSNGSIQRLDTTAFIGGLKAQRNNEVFSFGNDGEVKARTHATQDKVDVILDVPGNPGEKISASIKNYNLNKTNSITLQKGSRPLTYFIQDYPLFANHYLNITAAHEEGEQPAGNEVTRAHNLMKLTIATHALAGAMRTTTGRQATAELLIINDNSKGRYKVYYIDDLVRKLSNYISHIDIEGYDNPVWNNDFIKDSSNNMKSAYARVSKMLAELHRTNITKVSMSTNILNY